MSFAINIPVDIESVVRQLSLKDKIELVRVMREIVERLDKVAREADDETLAAELARMARDAAVHAAELEAADR